jgi:hypothetical protein
VTAANALLGRHDGAVGRADHAVDHGIAHEARRKRSAASAIPGDRRNRRKCTNIVNGKLTLVPPDSGLLQLEINVFPLKQTVQADHLGRISVPARRTA